MQNTLLTLVIFDASLLILVIVLNKTTKFFRIIFSAFLLLFLILLSELVYVGILKKKEAKVSIDPHGLFKKDSQLGYKYSRKGTFRTVRAFEEGDTIFSASYQMMEDTQSSAMSFPHRIGNSQGIFPGMFIFLGCSFAFGEGLDDGETLPVQFGMKGGFQTVNLGCSGYGIHQVYYLFQKKFAGRTNVETTFVYYFLPDHILRAYGVYQWNSSGPYFVQQNDSVVYKGDISQFFKADPPRWVHYVSARSSLSFIKDPLVKLALVQRISAVDSSKTAFGLGLINQMASVATATGGKLVVIYWDLGIDRYPEKMIRQLDGFFSAPKKYTLVRASSILNPNHKANIIVGDGHPSAHASEKIARFLVDRVKTRSLTK